MTYGDIPIHVLCNVSPTGSKERLLVGFMAEISCTDATLLDIRYTRVKDSTRSQFI